MQTNSILPDSYPNSMSLFFHHSNLAFLANSSSLQSLLTLLQPSIPWPNPPSSCLCTYQWVASQNVSLCASLMLNYATFGTPASSRLLRAPLHNAITAFLWNTLIRAYSIARVHDGFQSYNRMVLGGVGRMIIPSLCSQGVFRLCRRSKGMEIHGFVLKLGFNFDVFVGNTLLSFYGNCGKLREAVKALESYRKMNSSPGFKPNSVSMMNVLPACVGLEDELMARQIHCYTVKVGLDLQVTTGNALVDVYGKCGNVKASKRVFDKMLMIESGVNPNSITISSMLPVLVELGVSKAGKEIHGFSIRLGIETDIFIANSLIDMYAKSGHSTKASYVFHEMGDRNIVSWNAMIGNFAQNKLELSAIGLVRQMQAHGASPNSITFTNVLPACARLGFLHPGKEIHAMAILKGSASDLFVSNALTDMYTKCGCLNLARNVFNISLRDEQGKEIHGSAVRKHFHSHLFVANSVLDFYTKCGRIDLAAKVFDRIPNKDVASWNTMILGYGLLGELDTAISLLKQ
ncbi:hypothetical protein FNV43_RR03579 [Rhamnella rubrinervis]|uniref:Pentatricopeptide repeat-containing protein n=1 Tax=Rhamnella rubrinervis TaxID=2594499 RepID=A0A8K0HJ47_9ROSA|nr:hypothetical protein FNV43_RR03579 [Rhamnella rubrinervis]